MKGFKEFMMTAQKTKKCPEGYKFSKELGVCVPIVQRRYYPFYSYKGSSNGNGIGNGNGSIQIGTSENISTFIGGQQPAPSLNPTAIRNVSGLNKRGYPLYVLSTGEIVRGAAVNPIP